MVKAFLSAAFCSLLVSASADEPKWGPWIEPEFPFFSSSLDLRAADPDSKPHNITPRGLILNLGKDRWVCFDTDLLRVSAVWSGKGVTPAALGPLSYYKGIKTIGGQAKLPKADGELWMINGVYPGWQIGERVSLEDPREPQPTLEEPGRGPLPAEVGRFTA